MAAGKERKPNKMKKQGILVVSFGTSREETRKKTIEAVEQAVREAYPHWEVRRAFTSPTIRRILARQGLVVDSVPQALEAMLEDGFTQVWMLCTHLIPGEEYDKLQAEAEAFRPRFDSLTLTTPLLFTTQDYRRVAEAMMERHTPMDGEALIFLGHGTHHQANCVYPALDFTFREMGYPHVFVGTVEGYPDADSVVRRVKEAGYEKARLIPLMLVAGDHAQNDMAGDEPDSWKSLLEGAGIQTRCWLEGMGELPAIQKLYLDHLMETMEENLVRA